MLRSFSFSCLLVASASRVLAQEPTSSHPGQPLLEKVCASCHDTKTITATLRTKADWSDTIDEMIRYGAQASDDQVQQILDYLVRTYSLVNVNKASANELAQALDVSDDIAAAIVSYRSEHGGFKTIDDLKKVPGIDGAHLDARAKRLRY